MALFHFHVTQIKRSAGQSAIACAAYRAGEQLFSEYYGEVSDYTGKGSVVCAEILLPPQAPAEYTDRQTLWNAVEKAERGKKAQLAYSFDIALQNEFSQEENIALARQFLLEQFVGRGMIADFAIHQPDKGEGGIPNPHFHVMCPIRPIEPDGKWGAKQRRVYREDGQGHPILDQEGNRLFDAVPTTDWGRPETLEAWRSAWAKLINAKLEEKGLTAHIDHRSYERQGLEIVPTVHEGPAVRQMEARGVPTDKAGLNRWIRKANAMLQTLKRKLAALCGELENLQKEVPASPSLLDLLGRYYAGRNAGAWSTKGKVKNLKQYTQAVNYLTTHHITTLDELEAYAAAKQGEVAALKSTMKAASARSKELEELLHLAESYRELKPIHDELAAIRWKGKREQFQSDHDAQLRLFYLAQRKLKPRFTAQGKLPVPAWNTELAQLKQQRETAYEEYAPLWEDCKKLLTVRSTVDSAFKHQDQHQETKRRPEHHEI